MIKYFGGFFTVIFFVLGLGLAESTPLLATAMWSLALLCHIQYENISSKQKVRINK